MPEVNPPAAGTRNRGFRVAYFAGCATEFFFPQVGKAAIGLLNLSGVEVIFPKNQGCCGMAVHASGDIETAREMALHNLDVLSGLDADFIVTGCATCGSTLKEGWRSLITDDDRKAAFAELAGKIRDVSEFVVQLADFKPLRYRSLLPDNIRVTYHDPCHLARYQGIVEEPRKILKQVFGEHFVEMDNNGCCGFGGSFNLNNYRLSSKIGREKIESIYRSKADVVITTCPGCMIQLIDGIEREGMPQRVVHLANAVEPLEMS
jgi:glycolate oxidase iron-sulfur subunit